jgi:hypothetical protein
VNGYAQFARFECPVFRRLRGRVGMAHGWKSEYPNQGLAVYPLRGGVKAARSSS